MRAHHAYPDPQEYADSGPPQDKRNRAEQECGKNEISHGCSVLPDAAARGPERNSRSSNSTTRRALLSQVSFLSSIVFLAPSATRRRSSPSLQILSIARNMPSA